MDNIQSSAPAEPDSTLVALSPADMMPAQAELVAWCDRKIAAVKTELADIEANLELATEHGWKHASVASALSRTQKRIFYYEKMKAALEAGYVIVPNFPVDLFAVRVRRRKQRETVSEYPHSQVFNANAEMLPAGEGRYVDNRVFTTAEEYEKKNYKGETVTETRHRSNDYDTVDFPMVMVKPAIMEASARAMALRVFDEMGIVRNQAGRDPIVVGRLLDPRGRGRMVTFFVAWWLDTASL